LLNDKESWILDGDDFLKQLDKTTYLKQQTIGDHHGFCIDLFNNKKGHWLIIFNATDLWYPVFCYTFPDFLNLMSLISPVILMTTIQGGETSFPYFGIRDMTKFFSHLGEHD
jgi:hypothetical protein